MQFIERNSLNVRSAIYTLSNRDKRIRIILFPMIHVGEQKYFDEVLARLEVCDVIFAEGVKSRKAYLLTLSYRVFQHVKRLNLVTQQRGLKLASLRGEIVNTDMNATDFDVRWKTLPFVFRVQMFALLPFYVFYMLVFGSKDVIAENLAIDDLPSADEVLMRDEDFTKFDDLLINERDAILLRKLIEVHESNKPVTLGIVYGATHMRNVTKLLLEKLDYRVVNAEWVTVFDL